MRILIAHVRYRQRGGEDFVVDNEAALLRSAGHDVAVLDPCSDTFDSLTLSTKLQIGLSPGAHRYGRVLVREAIEAHKPEVVHFHNLYPLLGPGSIAEAASLGCATVQTFHNYRLSCLAGTHLRNGETCEQCAPGRQGRGVLHGCYRQSRLQSWSMSRALDVQWTSLARRDLPHVGICLTDYMRNRLTNLGANAETLAVKANSVRPTVGRVPFEQRSGAVFVGRLSIEKGIQQLVDAWPPHAPVLRVIGTGPLETALRQTSRANVVMLGPLSASNVRLELAHARVSVMPSTCFEGLPTVALESFAEATPTVGFDHGAVGALLAQQGWAAAVPFLDWPSLVHTAVSVCDAGRSAWTALSDTAVVLYDHEFTDSDNLTALESIYRLAAAGLHSMPSIGREETTSDA